VRVKLDAFPFTRYGTLQGSVLTVSNNAVPATATPRGGDAGAQEAAGPLVFPVRIRLDGQEIVADGEPVKLASGMSVTAEVKTGERRVIEFLLDPLLEMKDEAFHER
jgi:hemolysin D